jgi:hypothetical protein
MRTVCYVTILAVLAISVGCQKTNHISSSTANEEPVSSAPTNNRASPEEIKPANSSVVESVADSESEPAVADDMNWQILKHRIGQYNFKSKENEHENNR